MDLPRIGQSAEGLERLASSLGSQSDRLLVLARTGQGKAAIIEVDEDNRLRHVLLSDVSEKIARKLWGEVREGHLPHAVSIPRIPPLRGRAAELPEEDDRRRIALGLLAAAEEGLSARQLFEMRAVDRDRLRLWETRGWVVHVRAGPVTLSKRLYFPPEATGRPQSQKLSRPILVERAVAPRYRITEAGLSEWERLERVRSQA